jgi:hypothetical protein
MANITVQDLSEKKQNAKNAASVAAPAAFARSLILQGLALFYRTPIKVIIAFPDYQLILIFNNNKP